MTPILDLNADNSWLNDALCGIHNLRPDHFFVGAGHVIDDAVREMCRRCPVRLDCARHAYDRNFLAGFFAAMSHGQRKGKEWDEIVDYIRNDPPTWTDQEFSEAMPRIARR